MGVMVKISVIIPTNKHSLADRLFINNNTIINTIVANIALLRVKGGSKM